MLVFWVVTPCSCVGPEHQHGQYRRRENLKYHYIVTSSSFFFRKINVLLKVSPESEIYRRV
jgi:hypothetical protein